MRQLVCILSQLTTEARLLRIVYAGTPDFAVPALTALIEHGHEVCAVYTQPDRRAGRGRKVVYSAVKNAAVAHSVPVEQPQSLKDQDAQRTLESYQPDVMVVAAYGLILPVEVLSMPTHGCINIHGSLLPRWRGAAPIQRAIEAGDKTTGITIMQMDAGLDTGDMLLCKSCPIAPDNTAQQLHDQLAALGAQALLETLPLLEQGTLDPQPQDDTHATYAHKLEKSEANIQWHNTATEIHRCVCAFNPWPVAQTVFDGDTLRVWESTVIDTKGSDHPAGTIVAADEGLDIACGQGVLRLLRVQAPGKKSVACKDFLNSHAPVVGSTLG